mmetsp:Transcript_57838/g.135215  ORF Transcript_57838/g.135215 Transcript_57838/m.135215 type:complete len:227 (+) Transcript_57838:1477-2157(+)
MCTLSAERSTLLSSKALEAGRKSIDTGPELELAEAMPKVLLLCASSDGAMLSSTDTGPELALATLLPARLRAILESNSDGAMLSASGSDTGPELALVTLLLSAILESKPLLALSGGLRITDDGPELTPTALRWLNSDGAMLSSRDTDSGPELAMAMLLCTNSDGAMLSASWSDTGPELTLATLLPARLLSKLKVLSTLSSGLNTNDGPELALAILLLANSDGATLP